MKTLFQAVAFVLVLAGCNWPRLMEFRAQMGRTREFVAWEVRSGENVLTFRKPVLTVTDLQAAGLFGDLIDQNHLVIRYEWICGPPTNRAGCEITLLLDNGRLAGVIFPRVLQDGLGPENITGLLAMMGDRDNPAAGMSSLAKKRLISAGWVREPAAMGEELLFMLEPLDPRNRSLTLKLGEGQTPDVYSRFHLKLNEANAARS